MELISDFLGSPFLVLPVVFFIYMVVKHFRKNRCPSCGKGKMVEVESAIQKTIRNDYPGSSRGGGYSTMHNVVKVKSMCTNCREFYETSENR